MHSPGLRRGNVGGSGGVGLSEKSDWQRIRRYTGDPPTNSSTPTAQSNSDPNILSRPRSTGGRHADSGTDAERWRGHSQPAGRTCCRDSRSWRLFSGKLWCMGGGVPELWCICLTPFGNVQHSQLAAVLLPEPMTSSVYCSTSRSAWPCHVRHKAGDGALPAARWLAE